MHISVLVCLSADTMALFPYKDCLSNYRDSHYVDKMGMHLSTLNSRMKANLEICLFPNFLKILSQNQTLPEGH